MRQYTIHEAAERLGVSLDALHQQIAAGALRATSDGHDWHVTEMELARFEREHLRVLR